MVSDGFQIYFLFYEIYQKVLVILGLKFIDCNGKDYVGK